LIETWTPIRYRLSRAAAERFCDGLRTGVPLSNPSARRIWEAAWQIGISYQDQDFSIVDRARFAVTRRLGIERAASLADHFANFRFGPNGRRAFTILR
jgi:predicted nucleic acid-binding protein